MILEMFFPRCILFISSKVNMKKNWFFKNFKAKYENLMCKRIKIKSDNRLEFVNTGWDNYLVNSGTFHEKNHPH